MLFCWRPFAYKWETLKQIWLSVHFKQKVTKTHVIDCNLDTAIDDIMSSPQILGLRLSGSLLLGVTQIFSRKTKYLLTDCNHAIDKLKLSFWSDAPAGTKYVSCEGFEATVKEISFSEDFPLLSPSSDFNILVDKDLFLQNQSHPEEITLKEYSDVSQCHIDHFQPQELFGDEDTGFEMCLETLTNCDTHPDFLDFSPEEILNETPEKYSLNHQHDVNRERDLAEEEESLNQPAHEQTTFTLPPVPDTSSANKKRRRRKCKLIVDQMTNLTDKAMRMQLSDDSDLVETLILAPPTRQLMHWKESGKLLTRPCSNVIGSEIKEAFPKNVIPVTDDEEEEEEEREAVMRHSDHEAHSNMSPLSTESLEDSSTEHKLTGVNYSSDNLSALEFTRVEHRLDASLAELPSDSSMFLHLSYTEQHSQSLMGSQNFGEQQTVFQQAQAHMLMKSLNCCDDTPFCLRDLCSGHTRLQVARMFYCLLSLQKEGAVTLHQNVPYQDISVSAGPSFLTLENEKTNAV
ncbi:double-strand-break repair protein rad21-like protein 1 isoform X2 [Vanacampus margaritifer]